MTTKGAARPSGRASVPGFLPRTIDLPALSTRADVQTVNEEDRTVEIAFSTGSPVERYDWVRDERYIETLSLEEGHIRLERLNSGAPLLDSHSMWSVGDIMGTVVKGSATVTKNEARARVRFSKRADVEPFWQDVKDGIIGSISVGYRTYKVQETAASKNNKLPIRKAIDWEPYELSLIPVPADAGAGVRGDRGEMNSCVVVSATSPEEKMALKKTDDTRSDTMLEPYPLAPIVEEPEDAPEPNERDIGAIQERERVQGIFQACRAARLPQSIADDLIDGGTPLLEAQTRIFDELAKRDSTDVPRGGSRPFVRVTGEDPFVHVREGISDALLHRCYPKQRPGDAASPGFDLTEKGRPYRGMTLLRIAEAYLGHMGVRTTGFSKMELSGLAIGLDKRAGMHTTSDFALLLADVANKTLRASYEAAPQTFGVFSRRVTLPDFKDVSRVQIGEAPALLEVGEHGEFKHGTIGEGREKFALSTYGRIFAITRKALVNDDTDAFSRVAMLFGRSARNLESDLVWAQITANAVMADGNALFSVAHGNLAGTPTVIDIPNIGIGRAAMRNQTGLDGVTHLNINPVYLLVPPAIETVADQFVSVNLSASSAGNVNPFAGRLQVVSEPRLEADDADAWYLAATPDQVDIIEYGSLEGEMGPMVESRVGFDVDGIEIKARHDFAAKVIDHRGLFKNAGA
jgi:hypothetical protein